MREQVLWGKISRIVLLLSARLEISPERALNLFYETNVCAMLHDSRYGLHLMSDTYIINDVLRYFRIYYDTKQTKSLLFIPFLFESLSLIFFIYSFIIHTTLINRWCHPKLCFKAFAEIKRITDAYLVRDFRNR